MTAIATIRAPQFIVIAAESAVVDEHSNSQQRACKIHQIGNFIYTANKFAQHRNGYNLEKIISGCGFHTSLESLCSAIVTATLDPLRRALEEIFLNNPSEFAQQFAKSADNKRVAAGITLAGIENGKAKILHISFLISQTSLGSVGISHKINRCPDVGCPERCSTHPIVMPQGFLEKFELRYPGSWSGSADEVAANAEKLIQFVIQEKQSNDVGPPIAVVMIEASGVRWFRRGLCNP